MHSAVVAGSTISIRDGIGMSASNYLDHDTPVFTPFFSANKHAVIGDVYRIESEIEEVNDQFSASGHSPMIHLMRVKDSQEFKLKLNKSTLKMLAETIGDESADWINKCIRIADIQTYQGHQYARWIVHLKGAP